MSEWLGYSIAGSLGMINLWLFFIAGSLNSIDNRQRERSRLARSVSGTNGPVSDITKTDTSDAIHNQKR